jgi:hypothetical protein
LGVSVSIRRVGGLCANAPPKAKITSNKAKKHFRINVAPTNLRWEFVLEIENLRLGSLLAYNRESRFEYR